MQAHYSVKDIETQVARDEVGFRGFLQYHGESLNEVAQGITRQLLDTAAPVATLTKNQRYALFAAVADSNSYTPKCSNGCGYEHSWADMPESECSLCKRAWQSMEEA